MPDFRPADSFRSPRFAQPATFMRLPHTRELPGLDAALLGIPFDGGTSYRTGSRFGPRDIRQNSSLIRPYNPVLQVSPFDVLRVADVGDVDVNPINIEDTYGRVEQAVADVLNARVVPVCVGGGPSPSLPPFRARHPKACLGGVGDFRSRPGTWAGILRQNDSYWTPL